MHPRSMLSLAALAATLIAAGAAVLAARPGPRPPAPIEPRLRSGREVFDAQCRSCHAEPGALRSTPPDKTAALKAHADGGVRAPTDPRERVNLAEFLRAAAGAAPMPDRSAWPRFYRPLTKDVIVCAHRGFSGEFPENTLVAFTAAAAAGADMVELDVLLSKDGAVVLMHDDTVDRTTDGKGKVADLTLARLQALDAGSWKHPRFAGEPVPTLRTVLAAMKGRCVVDIEIKGEAVDHARESDDGLEAQVVRLVEELDLVDRVLVTSFDHLAIRRVKERNARIPTGLLHQELRDLSRDPVEAVRGAWADAFVANVRTLKEAPRNAQLHAARLPTLVYTVNEVAAMKEVLAAGVDGVITNYPDRLFAVLADWTPRRR